MCWQSVPDMPHGGAGGHAGRAAVLDGGLAQRFHFQLLGPGHDVVEPRVVGGDHQRVVAQRAAVDHAGQRHLHRRVGIDGRVAEMLVHGGGAGRQLVEASLPSASAIGRPMADHSEKRPPTQSHIGKMWSGRIPEVERGFDVRRDGHDLLDRVGHAGVAQPVHRHFGIGQRLGGGERFGGDDDQGVVRVQPAHRVGDGMRVHVRGEAHLAARAAVAQGARDQPRASSRPPMPRCSAAVAARGVGIPDEFTQAFAFRQHGLGHAGRRFGCAQGGMPGSAFFGPVCGAAIEQARPRGVEALLRQQGFLGFPQGGRIGLRAQVQAQPRSADEAQLLAPFRGGTRRGDELLPRGAVR